MKQLILKYALQNAVFYDGKANAKAVVGKIFAAQPELKKDAQKVMKEVDNVVKEVNKLSLEEQKEKLKGLAPELLEKKEKEQRIGLPDLPNAQHGKIVMRLAPFPSGQLHIGRGRMVILNDEYVKKYGGKLILVIDDTIGSEEKKPIKEAYDGIPEDLKWLGVGFEKTVYKSDRLEIFYKYAEEFLKKGWAYVCNCNVEKLRLNRKRGVECACRKRLPEENLKEWKKMLKGEYKEGEATVRLKTSMKDDDLAFRDRVLLRVCEREHPRVGKKYTVWPLLEFSWAIDDHLLGVTHILRGKDLVMEDEMEIFMWGLLGWKKPEIIHHGMLGIKGIKISSSECRKKIESGEYTGWDDPRTWTLRSLRKRGINPEAIRKFIASVGLSLTDITVPVDVLYSENRKIIESIANRYFFVSNPVEIEMENLGKECIEANLHPDFPQRGSRTIPVNKNKIYIDTDDFEKLKGKMARLMDLASVKLDKKSKNLGNIDIQALPKVQWVSEPNVNVKVVMPDASVKKGVGEPALKNLKIGDIIQFVRFGFCRLDEVNKNEYLFYFAHK